MEQQTPRRRSKVEVYLHLVWTTKARGPAFRSMVKSMHASGSVRISCDFPKSSTVQ